MFEDLNLRWAARRAAVVIVIYLGLLYVLSRVAPEGPFALQSSAQVVSLLVNAIFFFLIFTMVYAFVDRSRRRRLEEMRKRGKPSATGESTESSGALKGRPNPNTSRKKARRKR